MFDHDEEGLSYDVSETKNPIQLYNLDVEREFRHKGVATRFMKALCAYADSLEMAIELEVGGSDDDDRIHDLPAWYSTFGFAWMDGYMRRENRANC